MLPTACAVIDPERRLTPARALPLRCRLASAKMRSDHPLCMGSPDGARCLAYVARPTVFAHFPRKEDLFFDRYPEVAGQLARAIQERPAGTSAVTALRDTLVAAAQAGQAPYGLQADMIPWWRTVAASRALQARARELAEQLSTELAEAMAATGTAEPELAAAIHCGATSRGSCQAHTTDPVGPAANNSWEPPSIAGGRNGRSPGASSGARLDAQGPNIMQSHTSCPGSLKLPSCGRSRCQTRCSVTLGRLLVSCDVGSGS
jgi:alkylated DNA nucleotide flippase Atl1